MNRDKRGRFTAKKFGVFAVVIAGAILGSYIVVGPMLQTLIDGTQVDAVNADADPKALAQQMYGKNIDSLKAEVVSDIEKCESGGGAGANGLIQYDNNSHGTLGTKNIPSLGVLQFKVGTVQQYEHQLYGKDLSDHDAILLALDNKAAEALASDIIFQVKGGLWNWSCATPEMGIRVGIIKELAQ